MLSGRRTHTSWRTRKRSRLAAGRGRLGSQLGRSFAVARPTTIINEHELAHVTSHLTHGERWLVLGAPGAGSLHIGTVDSGVTVCVPVSVTVHPLCASTPLCNSPTNSGKDSGHFFFTDHPPEEPGPTPNRGPLCFLNFFCSVQLFELLAVRSSPFVMRESA